MGDQRERCGELEMGGPCDDEQTPGFDKCRYHLRRELAELRGLEQRARVLAYHVDIDGPARRTAREILGWQARVNDAPCCCGDDEQCTGQSSPAPKALRAGDAVTVHDGISRYIGEVKHLGSRTGPLVVALAPTTEDDVLPTAVTIGGKGHGPQTFEQCPGGC